MAMKPRKMMRGGMTEKPMPMKKGGVAKMPPALKKALDKKKMMRGGKDKK